MEQFAAILQRSGHRVTAARRRVFAALDTSPTPMTMRALIAASQTERTSVYRTIQLLLRLGVVSLVPIGWKRRYELAEPFRHHHHHLVCKQCGRVVDIASPQLESLITAVAHRSGYHLTGHHIELQGICAACQDKQPRL